MRKTILTAIFLINIFTTKTQGLTSENLNNTPSYETIPQVICLCSFDSEIKPYPYNTQGAQDLPSTTSTEHKRWAWAAIYKRTSYRNENTGKLQTMDRLLMNEAYDNAGRDYVKKQCKQWLQALINSGTCPDISLLYLSP